MSILSSLATMVYGTDEKNEQYPYYSNSIPAMAEAVPIPEPPGLPLIGNLGEFTTSPLQDIKRLADTYGTVPRICVFRLFSLVVLIANAGEIFRLHLGTRPVVFCSTNELVNELCDEKRFHKTLQSALRVREMPTEHRRIFSASCLLFITTLSQANIRQDCARRCS